MGSRRPNQSKQAPYCTHRPVRRSTVGPRGFRGRLMKTKPLEPPCGSECVGFDPIKTMMNQVFFSVRAKRVKNSVSSPALPTGTETCGLIALDQKCLNCGRCDQKTHLLHLTPTSSIIKISVQSSWEVRTSTQCES